MGASLETIENPLNGVLYVLKNLQFEENQFKIGSSKNLESRFQSYRTFYKDPSTLEKIYRIDESQYDCYAVDELLKRNSDNYKIKRFKEKKGGTEHYILENFSLLECFFEDFNIQVTDITSEIDVNSFRELSDREIDESEAKEKINKWKSIDKLNRMKKIQKKEKKTNKMEEREYQKDYINEIKNNDKCVIKAPTGAGKTYMMLKAIKDINYNIILILTPRRILNNQWIKEIKLHLGNRYNILNISNSENNETTTTRKIFENFLENKMKKIIIGCIASTKKLFEWITSETNLLINLMIVDETHEIKSWEQQDHHLFYLKHEETD